MNAAPFPAEAAGTAACQIVSKEQGRSSELQVQNAILQTQIRYYQKELFEIKQERDDQRKMILMLTRLFAYQQSPPFHPNSATAQITQCPPVPTVEHSPATHDLITFSDAAEDEKAESATIVPAVNDQDDNDEPLVFFKSREDSSVHSNVTSSATTVSPPSSPNSGTLKVVSTAETYDPATEIASTAAIQSKWVAPAPRRQTIQDSIWSSSQRRNHYFQVARTTARGTQADYWRYGLSYQADPQKGNTRHRVVIYNLPASTTLAQLFAKIRGGAVVSCELVDTLKITGSLSALVRFKDEKAASGYANFARAHPLVINKRIVTVTLLQTPSYPLPANLQAGLYAHGRTRCLRVCNYPREIAVQAMLKDVRPIWGVDFTPVEHIGECEPGVLEMRFSSISYAGSVVAVLRNFRAYHGSEVTFISDPCAGSLEELPK